MAEGFSQTELGAAGHRGLSPGAAGRPAFSFPFLFPSRAPHGAAGPASRGAPCPGRGRTRRGRPGAAPAAAGWVRGGLLGGLLAAALVFQAAGATAQLPPPRVRVVLAGEVFSVHLADTPQRQSRGLGGRARLAPREGMLFLYAEKSRHTFWMKAMLIPIDIIWLENRRVVHIHHNVPAPAPGTPDARLPHYTPDQPANGVLEIAAGRARALGLRVGQLVTIDLNPG